MHSLKLLPADLRVAQGLALTMHSTMEPVIESFSQTKDLPEIGPGLR